MFKCIFFQSCRPVFCPEGQIRVNDVCRIFGDKWYIREARLIIKLTPLDSSLKLDHLHEMEVEQLASPKKKFLMSPFLADFDAELFYRTHDNKTTIEYILALLFLQKQMMRPDLLMKNIEQSLRQSWKLNIAGNTFDLRAEFNKYITYSPYFDKNELSFAPHLQNNNELLREESVKTWSQVKSLIYMASDLRITKLFFCEQIRFQQDEFDIATAKVVLLALNKSFGDGEFIASTGPEGEYREIRMCLSDVLTENNGDPRYQHRSVVYVGALALCITFSLVFSPVM